MTKKNDCVFDRFKPKNIQVEAKNVFHLGGTKLSASFEISDKHDEKFHSFLILADFADNKVSFETLFDIPNSICSHVSHSTNEHTVLELGSKIHHLGPQGIKTDILSEPKIRKIWALDKNTMFVIGRGGSYRWEKGEWIKLKNSEDRTLNAIHGRDNQSIYVVGNNRYFAQITEDNCLKQIEVDFNCAYQAVYVSQNGSIYLGGDESDCMEYGNSKFTRIEAPQPNICIHDIREFKGKRYWTARNVGIYVQNGDKIELLRKFYNGFSMSASKDYLAITGWKEVFLFDGENWLDFRFSYDKGPKFERIQFKEEDDE